MRAFFANGFDERSGLLSGFSCDNTLRMEDGMVCEKFLVFAICRISVKSMSESSTSSRNFDASHDSSQILTLVSMANMNFAMKRKSFLKSALYSDLLFTIWL